MGRVLWGCPDGSARRHRGVRRWGRRRIIGIVTWRQGGRAAVFCVVVLAMGLPAGCSDSARDPGYFTIRPVVQQLPPPCAAPAIVQQGPDGEAAACFELGPPGIDARDIKSAEVQPSPRTGGAEVQFELTATGTERFNDLSRRNRPRQPTRHRGRWGGCECTETANDGVPRQGCRHGAQPGCGRTVGEATQRRLSAAPSTMS